MSLCAAIATARVLAEADVIVNVLLRRRKAKWGDGEKAGTAEIFFVPQEMKQAVHTLWLAKH